MDGDVVDDGRSRDGRRTRYLPHDIAHRHKMTYVYIYKWRRSCTERDGMGSGRGSDVRQATRVKATSKRRPHHRWCPHGFVNGHFIMALQRCTRAASPFYSSADSSKCLQLHAFHNPYPSTPAPTSTGRALGTISSPRWKPNS